MMNDTTADPIDVDQELYPALIQVFFIIGAGYVAGQLNLLTNTQTAGLSRFIGNFALPAVIFKNLVDVKFQSVSWGFLASICVAKAIVFFATGILTGISERQRNYARMGLYAIMTSQSNDFALMLPIIAAVYQTTHPDYQRYLYLAAPISLVILNPIGLFLIEIQTRLDDQKKNPTITWNRCQLIKKIVRNVFLNPIVICTILGVILNRIFHEQLPDILERILTPIAQSFSATALFYLGLSMVGKLRHFHAHLVITVLILNFIKLIINPLILRQAVYLFIKPNNGSLNNTIDYSNFGFLLGTAPTAPSVIFYVPDSDVALQAIASTGLVLSTLLAGPMMLISAKMINLRTLTSDMTQEYEETLKRTSYDVSAISIFCTIIVLIGFCLRRRLLRISVIHKYTFIYVGLQMVHCIWTIATQYVVQPIDDSASLMLNFGGDFLTIATRTWITSLSIILMISICYSTERARKYWWLYHLFGWGVPIVNLFVIYMTSKSEVNSGQSILKAQYFDKIEISGSIFVQILCLLTSSGNLLRIIRKNYKLKHSPESSRRESFTADEIRPLINDENEIDQSQRIIPPICTNPRPFDGNLQLLRHAVLVGIMSVNTFICIFVLLWSMFLNNHDGIYYELEFLDTVLLHGQGIITFLIFALDADILLPIKRKIIKLLNRFGLKISYSREISRQTSSQSSRSINFEEDIRSDFLRHSFTTQSMNNSLDPVETIFNGNDFCQWLVSNGHVEDNSKAQNYCQELVNKKQLIRINRMENTDTTNQWFAFSK